MDQAVRHEAQMLAQDLYAVIQALAPSRRDEEADVEVAEKLRNVDTRLKALRAVESSEHDEGVLAGLRRHLLAVDKLLADAVPGVDDVDEGAVANEPKSRWSRVRRRASPVYEAFASWLREQQVVVPSLRPSNLKRVAFHASSGVFAFILIEHVFPGNAMGLRLAALAFAVYCWTLEIGRRRSPAFNEKLMAMYGPLAHPHERHRVNSATWYATALLIISILAEPMQCSLAVLVLAFADPAAGLVGRRFGRTPLRAGRSLEGTLAFAAAGFLISFPMLALYYPTLSLGHRLGLAVTAGVFGALAELWTKHFDDNFMIPLAVAAFTTLYTALLF